MTPEEALSKVLASSEWRGTGGLDAGTIYGQLAMAVAAVAIAAERSECAKIADHTSAWCRSFSSEETAERIAAAIRARGTK